MIKVVASASMPVPLALRPGSRIGFAKAMVPALPVHHASSDCKLFEVCKYRVIPDLDSPKSISISKHMELQKYSLLIKTASNAWTVMTFS